MDGEIKNVQQIWLKDLKEKTTMKTLAHMGG
jgi:hypothetical protein